MVIGIWIITGMESGMAAIKSVISHNNNLQHHLSATGTEMGRLR